MVEGDTELFNYTVKTCNLSQTNNLKVVVYDINKSSKNLYFRLPKILTLLPLKYTYSQFNLPDVNKIDCPSLLVKTRVVGLPPM